MERVHNKSDLTLCVQYRDSTEQYARDRYNEQLYPR